MNLLMTAMLICALGLVLNRAYLRMALRRQLLDMPNHRSSHTVATPKGAGLVIGAVVSGFGLAWLFLEGPSPLTLAMLGGFPLVIVGLLDDVRDLRKAVRLATHLGCAIWAVWWLDNPGLGLQVKLPGFLAYPIQVLFLTWLMNLYNFMDGIDGIAGTQAIIFLGGIFALSVPGMDMSIHMAVLAAATVAFLAFNLPPARLFMGDAGSVFFGFAVGVITLRLAHTGTFDSAASMTLLAVFITDSTFTLSYRIATGQRWWQAHRSHLYQQMAKRWGHRKTLATFTAYALIWLVPMAALANNPGWQLPALVAACVPVFMACLAFHAGHPEPAATVTEP